MARRKRCRIAQAVWYEPSPSSRWISIALTPFLAVAISQAAWNHATSGV